MNKNSRKVLILIFWIALWWLLSVIVDNKVLLASPLNAVKALWGMLGKGSFYLTVFGSLLRIGAGFLMGFILAVCLAAASKQFGLLEELLAPFMNLIKTIPVASFVVLLLIWWGSSLLAVAISFLVVLPHIYISTLEGLKNADEKLLEMAQVFRMPLQNRFLFIFRPALKPFLMSSLKIALGMSWKSGVAAEVIGTPDYSIGEKLYLSKVYLDTAELFAWTAVVVVLCVLFEKLVLWLSERFFAWEPDCRMFDKRRKRLNQCDGVVIHKESILLEGVSKCYADQVVLNDICASYLPGETYYLTSPSGSGKTTLLRILAGLTKADSGSVSGVGSCSVVFQEDRLCEDYSAIKNVEMVLGCGCGSEGENAAISNCTVKEYAKKQLLELLPAESLNKPCRELSGGMKRRVALVRAFVSDSDVVLLDEPFTGMDAQTKERAQAYIREHQRGRTVIIATHI